MKCLRVLSFLLFTCGVSQPVLAHGAKIDYQQASAIIIRATFEDGTPIANAQAVVYSPKDPETPWLRGITDESGKFTFVPDSELSGNWNVKVRQAGHGKIISIPLEAQAPAARNKTENPETQAFEDKSSEAQKSDQQSKEQKSVVAKSLAIAHSSNTLPVFKDDSSTAKSTYSWQQKMIMSVSITWGLLGTALFFWRKQN